MRRARPLAVCLAVLAALTLAAPSVAGTKQRVAAGDYDATLVTPPGDYTFGRFTVAKAEGKRAIVPSDDLGAIYYPDANECEKLAAPLVAETIRVNRRGKFRIRERTGADAGDLVVTWSGRWTEPRLVSGRIVIRYGECVSRQRWTGAPAS